jgi:hypothetical protein
MPLVQRPVHRAGHVGLRTRNAVTATTWAKAGEQQAVRAGMRGARLTTRPT